jgi:hypothetical protein
MTMGVCRLAVGWATMFVVGTDLFVVSPLLPLIAVDYQISPSLAGLSVTVFSPYMVSAPLLGQRGESGLLSIYPPSEGPIYQPSNRRRPWGSAIVIKQHLDRGSVDHIEPNNLVGPIGRGLRRPMAARRNREKIGRWHSSYRGLERLTWPNGAEALLFSADEPERVSLDQVNEIALAWAEKYAAVFILIRSFWA